MSAAAFAIEKTKIYTVEEYFEIDAISEVKYEFVNGKLIEMPGEPIPNVRMTTNCITRLNVQFENNNSDCIAYPFNGKTAVDKKAKFRYPDVVVACKDEPDERFIQFPSLLLEVLSPGTEGIDKTDKLREYRNIPTVQYYLLVASKEISVQVYTRNGDPRKWIFEEFTDLEDVIALPHLNVELKVKDIYKGVNFGAQAISDSNLT
jgi:Uma2 family endonuclease